jgi:hypothetical protein
LGLAEGLIHAQGVEFKEKKVLVSVKSSDKKVNAAGN